MVLWQPQSAATLTTLYPRKDVKIKKIQLQIWITRLCLLLSPSVPGNNHSGLWHRHTKDSDWIYDFTCRKAQLAQPAQLISETLWVCVILVIRTSCRPGHILSCVLDVSMPNMVLHISTCILNVRSIKLSPQIQESQLFSSTDELSVQNTLNWNEFRIIQLIIYSWALLFYWPGRRIFQKFL